MLSKISPTQIKKQQTLNMQVIYITFILRLGNNKNNGEVEDEKDKERTFRMHQGR